MASATRPKSQTFKWAAGTNHVPATPAATPRSAIVTWYERAWEFSAGLLSPARTSIDQNKHNATTTFGEIPRRPFRPKKAFQSMTNEELFDFHKSRTEPTLNIQYESRKVPTSAIGPGSTVLPRRPSAYAPKTVEASSFVRTDYAGQALQMRIDVLLICALAAWLDQDYPRMLEAATVALQESGKLKDKMYIDRSCFYYAVSLYGRGDSANGDYCLAGCQEGLKGSVEYTWLQQIQQAVAYGKGRRGPVKSKTARQGKQKIPRKSTDLGPILEAESESVTKTSKKTKSTHSPSSTIPVKAPVSVKSPNASKLLREASSPKSTPQKPADCTGPKSLEIPSTHFKSSPLSSATIPDRGSTAKSAKSPLRSPVPDSGGIPGRNWARPESQDSPAFDRPFTPLNAIGKGKGRQVSNERSSRGRAEDYDRRGLPSSNRYSLDRRGPRTLESEYDEFVEDYNYDEEDDH